MYIFLCVSFFQINRQGNKLIGLFIKKLLYNIRMDSCVIWRNIGWGVLLVLVLVTVEISCLHIDHLPEQVQTHVKSDSPNPIQTATIQAVKLYKNDRQIQQFIDNLTLLHSDTISKFTCPNDSNYNFVIIDRQNNTKTKQQIVVTCNVHARQLLATEVCLQFINKLIQYQQESKQSQQINYVLGASKITVFYRGNDQRDNVINGKDYCIRKDGNDIDINRNFPTNFNFKNVPPSDQQYPGVQPLTQPFSICLDNYLKELNHTEKINLYIDIHTGQFTLYDSFESQSNATRPLLQKLKQKYCPQCRISSLGSQNNDDEVSNGQIFADIKKRYKAEHSVLLQIYGGYNDHLNSQTNCIAIFNPLTQKELTYYKNLWTQALIYFINQVLTNKQKSK